MALYAIFTREGCEETLKNEIEERFIRLEEEVYILMVNRLKKYDGEYRIVARSLFPEYVFIDTEDDDRLSINLRRNREIRALLFSSDPDENIVVLGKEEEKILDRLCGKDHILDISYGYKDEDGVHITTGPLVGMERIIKKVNRHKRIAVIEIDFLSKKKELIVGLDIENGKEPGSDT